MTTIIDSLRSFLGEVDFYLVDGSWNYGSMIEYFVASVVLCIVVSSVFKFLRLLVD